MKTFQYSFHSSDGLELFGQGWQPEEKPKGVVCLIHGLGEHSGRYAPMAERYTRAGYALAGFDLRGHGRSPGKRGDAPSFDAFMDDISSFIEAVRARFPNEPFFTYGHSLGGLLMLNYLVRRTPNVIAAVSSAAGLHTSLTEQRFKVWMTQTLGKVIPTFTLPTGLNPQMLSHDTEVVKRYIEDPLVHDKATVRMARETLASIQYVFEHAHQINIPLLVLHGSADRLTYPSGSQELAKIVPNARFVLFDGCYHELHNEPQKEEVYRIVIDWLNSINPS